MKRSESGKPACWPLQASAAQGKGRGRAKNTHERRLLQPQDTLGRVWCGGTVAPFPNLSTTVRRKAPTPKKSTITSTMSYLFDLDMCSLTASVTVVEVCPSWLESVMMYAVAAAEASGVLLAKIKQAVTATIIYSPAGSVSDEQEKKKKGNQKNKEHKRS